MDKFKVGDNIVYKKSNGDILHGIVICIEKGYGYPYLCAFDTADRGMELLSMMCDQFMEDSVREKLVKTYGVKFVCWMTEDEIDLQKIRENNIRKGKNDNEIFRELVNTYLKNVDGVNDLYTWLEERDFFSAPASTKYHGNFKGGLCRHSINVCNSILYLIKNNHFDFIKNIDIKSAVLVALFHDICKVDYYAETKRNVKNEITGKWEKVPYYTVKDKFPAGHGEKSVMIIQKYLTLTPDEVMAINWHMGFSDVRARDSIGANTVSHVFKEYPLAFLLHTADMMATYYKDRMV